MELTRDTLLERTANTLHAAVNAEESVMLSTDSGMYYGLNAVATRVWELLIERPMTVAELCGRICDEFDVDPPTCEAAVLMFATSVVENGLATVTA